MGCKTILTNPFDEILFEILKKRVKIVASILFVCMANRRLEQFEKK